MSLFNPKLRTSYSILFNGYCVPLYHTVEISANSNYQTCLLNLIEDEVLTMISNACSNIFYCFLPTKHLKISTRYKQVRLKIIEDISWSL